MLEISIIDIQMRHLLFLIASYGTYTQQHSLLIKFCAVDEKHGIIRVFHAQRLASLQFGVFRQ